MLEREGDFRTLALVKAGSTAIGIAITIVLALDGHRYMSFAYSQVAAGDPHQCRDQHHRAPACQLPDVADALVVGCRASARRFSPYQGSTAWPRESWRSPWGASPALRRSASIPAPPATTYAVGQHQQRGRAGGCAGRFLPPSPRRRRVACALSTRAGADDRAASGRRSPLRHPRRPPHPDDVRGALAGRCGCRLRCCASPAW